MVTISVKNTTFERLQNHSVPLRDDADAVVNRALDALDWRLEQEQRDESPPQRVDDTDVTHTRIINASLAGTVVPSPNWSRLVHLLLVKAASSRNFEELKALSGINIVNGYKTGRGFHHLPEIDVSVQWQNANKLRSTIERMANGLDISVEIEFEWQNKRGAAHPGERGLFQLP